MTPALLVCLVHFGACVQSVRLAYPADSTQEAFERATLSHLLVLEEDVADAMTQAEEALRILELHFHDRCEIIQDLRHLLRLIASQPSGGVDPKVRLCQGLPDPISIATNMLAWQCVIDESYYYWKSGVVSVDDDSGQRGCHIFSGPDQMS
eukprot:scaffold112904_cov35-Prasinocladus_malaysianus.AAC.1